MELVVYLWVMANDAATDHLPLGPLVTEPWGQSRALQLTLSKCFLSVADFMLWMMSFEPRAALSPCSRACVT